MTPEPLIAFPLGALGLAILYPLFDRQTHRNVSRSLRSRARRRLLIGRTAVIVMVLAAAVSEVLPLWPEPLFGKFLQATLICAAVLLPLLAVHAVVTWRSRERPSGDGAVVADGAVASREAVAVAPSTTSGIATSGEAAPDGAVPDRTTPDRAASAVIEPDATARPPRPSGRAPVTPSPAATDAGAADTAPGGGGLDPVASRHEHERLERAVLEREDVLDEPDDDDTLVSTQLARLTALIGSHDLGDERDPPVGEDAPPGSGASVVSPVAEPSGSSALVRTGVDMAALSSTARELRRMSGREIVALVDSLRGDRVRLQKLVVAQQAAYQSERQAHERTRTVARDAVTVMRTARESQKLAEKVARRERRKRLHLEERYEKVARALDNAVSIVETRARERPSRANGAPGADGAS